MKTTDISPGSRAVEALVNSEKTYRYLYKNIPSGLAVYEAVDEGQDFIVIQFNPAAEKITRRNSRDILGKRLTEAFSYIQNFGLLEIFRKVWRDGVSIHVPASQYIDEYFPDGIWLEIWAYRLSGNEIVALYKDVSELKSSEALIRRLTQQLIMSQEEERLMISLELHDTIAQDLVYLKFATETLFDRHTDISDETKQKLSDMTKLIQKSIDNVRNMSYQLLPPGLDQFRITQIFYQYLDEFSEKTGIQSQFVCEGFEDLKLDYQTQVNLYRIMQEGLNNVRKHARAGHVTVALQAVNSRITLRVEDDGKGFEVEKIRDDFKTKKRMGLYSMHERAAILNGKLTIRSVPGDGTKILAEIPLKG